MRFERELWLLYGVFTFLVPYFLINKLMSEKAFFYDLTLSIDLAIPFIPFFIIFYISTYAIVLTPYFIIKDKAQYIKTTLSVVLTLLIGYFFFIIFPVLNTIRHWDLSNNFFEKLVYWEYLIDMPGLNTFPSLHVAVSLLVTLANVKYDKKFSWMWVWLILIVLSTMVIKQHFFLDVVGGLLLGVIGYLIYLGLLKSKSFINHPRKE